MDVIYLDNNATTPLAAEVLEAMMPYLTSAYGNPSSAHRIGQEARAAIDNARGQTAALLGCSEGEVSFTGGGTEAVNTAIRGILAGRAPRKRLVTSTVEHSACRELCRQLVVEGFEVVYVGVNQQGDLDLDQLRSSLTDQTALVSLMWANNETGVLFPVEDIAPMCRSRGIPLHVDATQVMCKLPVNVKALGIDGLSCAPHKFHGPKGVGVICVRRGLKFRPLVVGGPQENNRRGGTENVPGIVGAGKAAEIGVSHLSDLAAVAARRDRFEQAVLERIADTHINGRRERRVPNTTNISFTALQSEAILLALSEQGVCASAGSACSSGSMEPSFVLQAMKIDHRIAFGAIRFSLSRYTTDAELDRALEILPGTIARLRAVMPMG
ncbi:MAG: aminotransferase class V-fold PLP-dependent enzyme [Tepidisphaeraceae bacterium]|jgi:cysteine desulfurase